jgi:hypothetical protein
MNSFKQYQMLSENTSGGGDSPFIYPNPPVGPPIAPRPLPDYPFPQIVPDWMDPDGYYDPSMDPNSPYFDPDLMIPGRYPQFKPHEYPPTWPEEMPPSPLRPYWMDPEYLNPPNVRPLKGEPDIQ